MQNKFIQLALLILIPIKLSSQANPSDTNAIYLNYSQALDTTMTQGTFTAVFIGLSSPIQKPECILLKSSLILAR